MIKVIGIRFHGNGKVYYFDPKDMPLKDGQHVIVETAQGQEYGSVVLYPREVAEERVTLPLRPVIRLATEEDTQREMENREKEDEAYRICFKKIEEHGLDMKLIKAEYTFDRKKILFYFTHEGRVDFRELVKDLASVFKTRIELRQVGVRDETKLLGGIGTCGRPLCCSTFLSDFSSVSIKMAKEQNLSLNPTKISGACGRLMCCLKNEQETYEYLNKNLPGAGDVVRIKGEGNMDEGVRIGEVLTVNVLRQSARVLIEVGDDREIEEVAAEQMEVVMTRKKKNRERAKERERLQKEKKEQKEKEKGQKKDRKQKHAKQNDEQSQDKHAKQNDGYAQDKHAKHKEGHPHQKQDAAQEKQQHEQPANGDA